MKKTALQRIAAGLLSAAVVVSLQTTPAIAEPTSAERTSDERTSDERTFVEPTSDERTFVEPTSVEPTSVESTESESPATEESVAPSAEAESTEVAPAEAAPAVAEVEQATALPFDTSVPEKLGANDPTCQPTGRVQEPVVLIHGTSDSSKSWSKLIPVLRNHGMCVWAFDYGAEDVTIQKIIPSLKGLGDIKSSANEVTEQIRYVREQTGAEKVNLVGHSQGGLHTKIFTEVNGGADEVARIVNVGANYHGTTLNGSGSFMLKMIKFMPRVAQFFAGTASIQQVAGTDFMNEMNTYKDTTPGISYTSIYSDGDTTVTPHSASELPVDAGADVVNINVTELCGAKVAHPQLMKDPDAMSQIVWGLQREEGAQPDSNSCGDLGLQFLPGQ